MASLVLIQVGSLTHYYLKTVGHPGAGRIFLRCAADESSTVHPNYEPSLSHSSEPVVFIEQQRLTQSPE